LVDEKEELISHLRKDLDLSSVRVEGYGQHYFVEVSKLGESLFRNAHLSFPKVLDVRAFELSLLEFIIFFDN
jgi:hypothetical protein